MRRELFTRRGEGGEKEEKEEEEEEEEDEREEEDEGAEGGREKKPQTKKTTRLELKGKIKGPLEKRCALPALFMKHQRQWPSSLTFCCRLR